MSHLRRRSAFADRLLEFPGLVFSDGAEFKQRGRWREHFSHGVSSTVIVEIGCNDASLLATVAAKHADVAFVGMDWNCRALHGAAERVTSAGLRNVALLHARGQDLTRLFAEREVDEIWLFHPDPCDKPRERANRLFAERFLINVAEVLREPGAALVLKTDHREYYESALALAGTQVVLRHFDVSASSDFWADEVLLTQVAARCFAGETSEFEGRFRRKRKPIHYLELRKR